MKKGKYYTVKWAKGSVKLLDQTLLPHREVYRTYKDYRGVVAAIKNMEVRGAPAIGVAAALGIALGVCQIRRFENIKNKFITIARAFLKSRPTAVNLEYAVKRMARTFYGICGKPLKKVKTLMIKEAMDIYREDLLMNKTLCEIGQKVIKDGSSVLTHCNSGPLAASGHGTALGVIIAAKKNGKKIRVFADETRPRLQGAKLSSWELLKNGVDATLICDNMAGHCMKCGLIDMVITGADRIAANGDSANKIGTYSLALLAAHHGIPFYIAAPTSTIDTECPDGSRIPIEERDGKEITALEGKNISARGIKTFNPGFDVTPSRYIRGIITEKGILKAPYKNAIKRLFLNNKGLKT